MGLYDREYIRDRPGGSSAFGGGIPRLSRWSVNTWIIVINVAIFVSQAFILSAFGPVEVNLGDRFYQDTTSEQMGRAQQIGNLRPSQGEVPFLVYQLIDPTTNRPVGERPVANMEPLQAVGHFSTLKTIYRFELWRFLSFQFLHADTTHLFFNMLMLFFFGGLVESYLGRARYLAYYLTTGACGGVLYLMLNLAGQFVNAPIVLVNDIASPLIGASAGVFGVMMACAFIAPNATVLFMFIIPMRLAVLVYALTGVAALTIISSGQNAGGEAAHLGGAISGFFLIRNTRYLRRIADTFSFSKRPPKHRLGRQTPRAAARPSKAQNAGPSEAEIDRILSKVATQGMHSLSKKEKETLKRATDSKR